MTDHIPNLTISVSQDDITLNWDSLSDADKYEIYRSQSNSGYSLIDTITSTSYSDNALLDGEKYYYEVAAISEKIEASGGIEYTYDDGSTVWRCHEFQTDGTLNVTNFPNNASVDVLVVGGGGGGGTWNSGGGGAGGLIYDNSYSINGDVAVTVGAGSGGGNETQGGDSSFGSITATGGGYGDAGNGAGDGGSGGGEKHNSGYGSGISGQGYRGGFAEGGMNYDPRAGGGGGGASEVGHDGTDYHPGDGGAGLYYGDKFGDSVGENGYFAGGGGGGGRYESNYTGYGGNGGGGNGGNTSTGQSGMDYTGGGGGGGGDDEIGGDGGKGVVLVRYED